MRIRAKKLGAKTTKTASKNNAFRTGHSAPTNGTETGNKINIQPAIVNGKIKQALDANKGDNYGVPQTRRPNNYHSNYSL